jgi:hypothetical protein
MSNEAIPVAHLPELFGLHPLTVAKMVAIGVFGAVTIPAGYSRRHRTVARREIEKRFGALTDERIADAAARHSAKAKRKSAAARTRRAKELETTSGRAPRHRTEKRRARPAVSPDQ